MSSPRGRPQQVRELLSAWRDEPIANADRGVSDPERHVRAIAAGLRGVAERRRRSGRWARGAAGLAIAASVAGVAVSAWYLNREPTLSTTSAVTPVGVKLASASDSLRVSDAAGHALARGAQLGAGAELQTGSGHAELEFASGARTQVFEAATLSIAEAGVSGRETILLSRGRVEVEVPELRQHVVFSVKTPDALVVVHGTRFSVEVAPPGSAKRTRVAVTRGVVAVHSGGQDVRLVAGEQWPTADGSTADAVTPEAAHEAQAEPAREVPDAAPSPRTSPKPAREPSSRHKQQSQRARAPAREPVALDEHQLSEENRLFAVAMAKKKSGDTQAALTEVESFIEQYPQSVLLQEARVERFRLLHRLGRRREAARHARQYLGDYREGYARDEARAVAVESP